MMFNTNSLWRRISRLVLVLAMFAAAAPAAEPPVRILVLGDSLVAGYGLATEDAFPVRLEARLRRAGYHVRVINAGVSGDTTAGGLARLDWALAEKPHIAIVELGANDGMRAINPMVTRRNLNRIVGRIKDRGVAVLLTGMVAPPNLGPAYGAAFKAVFPAVAKRHGVAFYPFFLAGVAAQPELNQRDGLHPNERGVATIVDRIVPYVVRLLQDL
jgi:acyl-CoA thioesterase-1